MSKALSVGAGHALIGSGSLSVRGTRAEVSASALVQNLETLRLRAAGCELCAVVKANGYGLGAELVAGVLAREGVQHFGVATVEEGLTLRAAGISGTILVLGGATWLRAPALLVDAALTPVLWSPDEVQLLDAFLQTRPASMSSAKHVVHVAVDTGMGREGWTGPEVQKDMVAALKTATHLRAEGAMTHFANADLADGKLSEEQVARFALSLTSLRQAEVPIEIAHIANSAAVLSFGGRPGPLANEEFSNLKWWVRPGLALTGVTPFPDGREQERLQPALRWVASVVGRKRVPANTSISYGSTFVTTRESEIAILGLGYADGFQRAVSGQGAEVLIASERAPILGRVCMDLCVIDLTDLSPAAKDAASLGAEVTILGQDGHDAIDAWALAEQAGTIAYEIQTSIGARVPKVPVS